MKKIPTVYRRDPQDMKRVLLGDVTPGCEWVLAGEGTPTRKYDGTCVMFDGERWWARREVKPSKQAPAGFQPISTDEATGKTVGWEPVEQSGFAKWHAEAVANHAMDYGEGPAPGTYELIGPKVQGNSEKSEDHRLIPHADAEALGINDGDDPLALIADCRENGWEGVVWHHPDGRMAKLKVRDVPERVVTPPMKSSVVLKRSDGTYYTGSDLAGARFGPFGYAVVYETPGAADDMCRALNDLMQSTGTGKTVEAVSVDP